MSELKANREQINSHNSKYGQPYPGLGDRQFDWYILPRIRIDSNDAYANKKVCKIEIHNYDDNIILSQDLYGFNFRDNSSPPSYNGSYIDKFFSHDTLNINLKIARNQHEVDSINAFNPRGLSKFDSSPCYVDFKVYWYGECDMWIDRIRVEDDRAFNLFEPSALRYAEYQNYLNDEKILASRNSSPYRFYTEELEFKHLPCLKKVYDKIRESQVQAMFYGSFGNGWYSDHLYLLYGATTASNVDLGVDHFIHHFIDSLKPKEYFYGSYPICRKYHTETGGTDTSMVPSTIGNNITNNYVRDSMVVIMPPNDYDNWLQSFMEDTVDTGNHYRYGEFFQFLRRLKYLITHSTQNPINLISAIQAHSLHGGGDGELREPTNEEIEMMVNLSLTYGSKGIIYNQYISWGGETWDSVFSRGLIEKDYVNGHSVPRTSNDYGQDKWQRIIDINKKLNKWGPTLMGFNNANINSYIYRNPNDRAAMRNNSYFQYFSSFKPGSGTPDCGNQDYIPDNVPYGYTYDCPNSTYLQIATFENTVSNTQYFMVVNRRCSPCINSSSEDNRGGRRKIRACLKSDYYAFNNPDNWGIIDCETGDTVQIFYAHSPLYIELGWYLPGEGKLYKIVPITETGGTLAGDEYINTTVTIKKSIYSGGHNITIGPNANISFSDSAGIYMSGGGVLKIGNENQTYGTGLQMHGTSGGSSKWQGFNLDGLDTVLINGATFSNILPNQPAINMTNCYHFKIEGCQFNCAENDNTAGIYADYNEVPYLIGDSIFQHIGGNSFNFNNSSNNIIQVVSTASPEIPIIIEDNQINVGPEIVTTSGIFLSNITGGVIKNNEIRNCLNGIVLVSSNCDFFENIISSNYENSIAISLKIGEGEMGPSNGYFVGGYNDISTIKQNSKNIDVGDSYFDIVNGYNSFDIDYNLSPYHIAGYFPSSAYLYYKAGYNCFKNNHTQDTACINVTQGFQGSTVTLDPIPYYCQGMNLQDFIVFSLPGNIRDTIYYTTSGNGGGYNEGQARAVTVDSSYKSLKDSININTRKRNYNLLEIECKEMLSQYPDSSVSIPAVSKLYLSSLSLDNQGNHISTTKTFLENLILNNPNNVPLIKKANYFVQKCKVSLHQYASALQGFQEIMNQNPYSYEGLIASWDYAATTLLMGSGAINDQLSMYNVQWEDEAKEQSEKEIKDLSLFTSDFSLSIETLIDTLKNRKTNINSYLSSDYDKSRFTKKDREVIKGNVENAFQKERNKQISKLTELEKKITELTNNNSSTINNTSSTTTKNKSDVKSKKEYELKEAKKELKVVKALSDVVKTKRPKTVIEHKKTVSQEIKKVFGVEKLPLSPKTNTNIPTEYKLSQNYPNPFNPVTKINYDLPKDAKVKLVIYNILGQEMKVLVNNEFKQAGRYMVEFNGSYFASGIYFYRMLVDEGKNFSAVKKMVLVK